jgi:dUTP pyrophosphatase
MILKFKKYNENAVIPQKAYEKDFCYDLVAVSEEEIAPNVWKYGFGFGLQIDRGYEPIFVDQEIGTVQQADLSVCPFNLSVDIRPRSSVWKTGMVLSNCTGTVDENYTGEISSVFYHVMPNMPRYKVGDRIAQAKIGITFPIEFMEVEELDKTDRNDGGYGSTGK